MLEAYLSVLELGYFEVQEAFKGLSDENLWKRPATNLLSVGELAAHLAYSEAVRLACEGRDLTKCQVSSPLIDDRLMYYPHTLVHHPSEEQLAMTAEQVLQELLRVHRESVAYLKAINPDLESSPPGWSELTYGETLQYMTFHIAYHTGQIYSARHLLGEETVDN